MLLKHGQNVLGTIRPLTIFNRMFTPVILNVASLCRLRIGHPVAFSFNAIPHGAYALRHIFARSAVSLLVFRKMAAGRLLVM